MHAHAYKRWACTGLSLLRFVQSMKGLSNIAYFVNIFTENALQQKSSKSEIFSHTRKNTSR